MTDDLVNASGGIVAFLIFVLDVVFIFEVLNRDLDIPSKILWITLIGLFPIGGVLAYYLFSHRHHVSQGGYEAIV